MADGRICDGIGFAQIKPDLRCASMPDRSDHSSTEPRLGARLSRVPRTAGDLVCGRADEWLAEYLCSATVGVNARFPPDARWSASR
jgi:hypothetical protein